MSWEDDLKAAKAKKNAKASARLLGHAAQFLRAGAVPKELAAWLADAFEVVSGVAAERSTTNKVLSDMLGRELGIIHEEEGRPSVDVDPVSLALQREFSDARSDTQYTKELADARKRHGQPGSKRVLDGYLKEGRRQLETLAEEHQAWVNNMSPAEFKSWFMWVEHLTEEQFEERFRDSDKCLTEEQSEELAAWSRESPTPPNTD